MRTTVRLDDGLLDLTKREAAPRGETVTSLIEQGLRIVLLQTQKTKCPEPVRLPISNATGGTLPGIDLNNSADVLDVLEGFR